MSGSIRAAEFSSSTSKSNHLSTAQRPVPYFPWTSPAVLVLVAAHSVDSQLVSLQARQRARGQAGARQGLRDAPPALPQEESAVRGAFRSRGRILAVNFPCIHFAQPQLAAPIAGEHQAAPPRCVRESTRVCRAPAQPHRGSGAESGLERWDVDNSRRAASDAEETASLLSRETRT